MTRGMTRDKLLDDAISKAKDNEDWQLVEWLRMVRGGVKAAHWYVMKLDQMQVENNKLRELARDMWDWLAPTATTSGAPLKELHGRMDELGVTEDK